jgi:hypothetical protein
VPSERIQRQIDDLLDEAGRAVAADDWEMVRVHAGAALRSIPRTRMRSPTWRPPSRDLGTASVSSGGAGAERAGSEAAEGQPEPTSFAGGRYVAEKVLGIRP